MKPGYISAQKLATGRAIALSLYFTENQCHQELVYSRRDWKVSPKFLEIKESWSKSRCALDGLGYYFSLKIKRV